MKILLDAEYWALVGDSNRLQAIVEGKLTVKPQGDHAWGVEYDDGHGGISGTGDRCLRKAIDEVIRELTNG